MFGKNLTSKSSQNKIFCRFRVFEYGLWQKMKHQQCQKLIESCLNQKAPNVNDLSILENC